MNRINLSIKCPKCKLPAEAKIEEEGFLKFIIFKCPKCGSNVVLYNNKIDIISNKLLRQLLKKHKLKYCGNVLFDREPCTGPGTDNQSVQLTTGGYATKQAKTLEDIPEKGITKEKLIDLKILLETENDFDKIVSKL